MDNAVANPNAPVKKLILPKEKQNTKMNYVTKLLMYKNRIQKIIIFKYFEQKSSKLNQGSTNTPGKKIQNEHLTSYSKSMHFCPFEKCPYSGI